MKNIIIKFCTLFLVTVLILLTFPLNVGASPIAVFDDADPVPINPNANQTCKNFYQYLWNLRKTNYVISGAQSFKLSYEGGYELVSPEGDNFKYIQEEFGVTPVIFGSMDEYSSRTDEGFIKELAERYKQGAIPTFGYEPASLRRAQVSGNAADLIMNLDSTNPDRDMEMYNEYRRELEIEADGFEAMEKAGIEVYMYRFFAEINNTLRQGYYGASKEGYEACHRVWQQAVDYFINERGLTGILFVYCAAGYTTSNEFYPGDDYVDIIGPTTYSVTGNGEIYSNENYADYYWTKDIKKVFGFTEVAPRSYSAHDKPDAIGDYKKLIDSVIRCYPEASFAHTWYCDCHSLVQPGDLDNVGNYNGLYYLNSPNILHADDVPNFSAGIIESNGIIQFYSNKKAVGNLSLGKFSATDLKKKGIDISKIDSLNILHGTALLAYESNDCSGQATIIYGSDQKLTSEFKKAKSLEVIELENLALEKNIWVEDHFEVSAVKLNDGLNALWEIEPNDDGKISIIIDLGTIYNIGQMSINHAGFYEDFKYNLRDFEIYVSNNGKDYVKVYRNVGNVYPASDFWFNHINARYVMLKVLTPNSSTSEVEKARTSLAEIEIYGLNAERVISSSNASKHPVIEDTNNNETTDAPEEELLPPEMPAIVIPEFYNYVWIIIVGGLLLLTAIPMVLLLVLSKKRK